MICKEKNLWYSCSSSKNMMISYDIIWYHWYHMISYYIYDISDIIDVMGTCSRVFQGTRWHVMWYHMISYHINDIIWLSYYLGSMFSNPHYINDITDIIYVIWYHMISVILFLTYNMISYDITSHLWYQWYHNDI